MLSWVVGSRQNHSRATMHRCTCLPILEPKHRENKGVEDTREGLPSVQAWSWAPPQAGQLGG